MEREVDNLSFTCKEKVKPLLLTLAIDRELLSNLEYSLIKLHTVINHSLKKNYTARDYTPSYLDTKNILL